MLWTILILLAVFIGVPLLLGLKTSRPDGVYIAKIHKYRHMMQFIMRRRNESYVMYDTYARAEKLLEYLEQAKGKLECDLTHCIVGACAIGLQQTPEMNTFVAGRRLYRRKGRWVTFSMKRKQMDRKARLSAVKMRMEHGETFAQLCKRVGDHVGLERSGTKTYTDKEFDFFTRWPRPLMNLGTRFLEWLDYYGLMPGSFIEHDAMYTSVFVANLGSVGMSAGYHHLYEWGTSPLFMMVGRIEDRVIVEDGKPVVVKVLPIRWTYDERIDDGLTSNYGIMAVNQVLENPFERLGCLAEDGSDAVPLTTGPEE